jgi:ribonuclease T2
MTRFDHTNPMQRRRRRRKRGMSVAAAVAALLSAIVYQWNARSTPDQPAQTARKFEPVANNPVSNASATQSESFDFYLMALSLHPAFCEDGNANKRDCQRATAADNARRPLVIHGLWPENRRPESYPRDCVGPRLDLSRALREELAEWMPGTVSGLHNHEWRKHGTCSGLEAEQYFRQSIALAERANSALGKVLLASIDSQVSAAALRRAADAAIPGFGATLTFHCRNPRSPDPVKRRRPYLTEIRLCIDNDGANGAPGTALACENFGRRDQGCGAQFWIDGV